MSLITRCPTCETMFRVVPDQLRVSEGWVRCGQCAEVFDATQNMVPSGDDAAATPPTAPRPTSNTPSPTAPVAAPAPPAPPRHASSAPPPPPVPTPPATTTPATAAPMPEAPPDAPPDENRFTPSPAPADRADRADRAAAPHGDGFDVGDTMRPAIDSALENDWQDGPPTDPQTASDAPYDADADDTDTLPPPELDFPPVPEPGRDAATDEPRTTGTGTDAARAHAAVPRPSFLQDEQSPSIWRRPMVRLALVVTLVVLLVLLGVQLLVKERDRVAAAQPGMRSVLEALCTVAGCTIAPLRQIESIVIDSSSFSRVRGDDYRLGFSLKNTAPIDVAMPAVELSLTDPQDQPVIRRVILPAEFGARSDALAGESVWTGSLALTVQADASAQRVAGYRLLAFYP
ncbi:DUF3426 domain-containing protein [Comamonadaceae bacterium G21597-S1]|nr:DUF3426 domain-containing protein [Comamonadaceae bacterium G21597-S1]